MIDADRFGLLEGTARGALARPEGWFRMGVQWVVVSQGVERSLLGHHPVEGCGVGLQEVAGAVDDQRRESAGITQAGRCDGHLVQGLESSGRRLHLSSSARGRRQYT